MREEKKKRGKKKGAGGKASLTAFIPPKYKMPLVLRYSSKTFCNTKQGNELNYTEESHSIQLLHVSSKIWTCL